MVLRYHIPKEMRLDGAYQAKHLYRWVERTRENFKEEQDILFRIIDRLHSEVLNGHSGKAFSRLEFVSYNDGTAGFEFLDHDNNTSVRLSVVFGISDLEPYRAPTNLELCDPYRGKCSIDGIELSYDEKSREVIGILKNQHMFFQADNNWPRIHKIGVDKNYVWLLDSSGRYWRVVHGADRISEILGHRHKGQKDPKLTSTTCEKVVCTQWMN
jgi:hypothetical protein